MLSRLIGRTPESAAPAPLPMADRRTILHPDHSDAVAIPGDQLTELRQPARRVLEGVVVKQPDGSETIAVSQDELRRLPVMQEEDRVIRAQAELQEQRLDTAAGITLRAIYDATIADQDEQRVHTIFQQSVRDSVAAGLVPEDQAARLQHHVTRQALGDAHEANLTQAFARRFGYAHALYSGMYLFGGATFGSISGVIAPHAFVKNRLPGGGEEHSFAVGPGMATFGIGAASAACLRKSGVLLFESMKNYSEASRAAAKAEHANFIARALEAPAQPV